MAVFQWVGVQVWELGAPMSAPAWWPDLGLSPLLRSQEPRAGALTTPSLSPTSLHDVCRSVKSDLC